MLTPLAILSGVAAAAVAAGVVERQLHLRNLGRIPTRVHVNGTRGKSSVTRLIAAGLRQAGVPTCAKVTGTLARMIMNDGQEFPVFRPARANVHEQIRIVSTAAKEGAKALVIECMALQPEYQWLCEWQFVRATHGVITNCRADHLDVMGPTERDVAWALCGMVPPGQKLFTSEARHLDILRAVCDERQCRLFHVTEDHKASLSDADMAGFRYTEHRENVALALLVTSDLGVDRRTALEGMWDTQPDPGAMTACELGWFGRRIVFVNGFAANDPESTERIWNIANDRYPAQRRVAVFNCRADRADRSRQLGEVYAGWRKADATVLIGTGTYAFVQAAEAAGMDSGRFVIAEGESPEEIFETLIPLCGTDALIMGMGNIGGPGLPLVRYFQNRAAFTTEFR